MHGHLAHPLRGSAAKQPGWRKLPRRSASTLVYACMGWICWRCTCHATSTHLTWKQQHQNGTALHTGVTSVAHTARVLNNAPYMFLFYHTLPWAYTFNETACAGHVAFDTQFKARQYRLAWAANPKDPPHQNWGVLRYVQESVHGEDVECTTCKCAYCDAITNMAALHYTQVLFTVSFCLTGCTKLQVTSPAGEPSD
jgi:hypothetical protein